MTPAHQLELELEVPPPLRSSYPQYSAWMLRHARTSVPVHDHTNERERKHAIWSCACGKTMVGIRGGTQ